MNDTPETDAELAELGFGYYTMGGLPTDAVKVEFARKLERERDVAQKAMGDARDVLLDAMPDANAPTKILAEMIVAERDEAIQARKDSATDWFNQIALADLRVARIKRERDEAASACHIWQKGHSAIVAERDSNQRQADALVDQLGAIQERIIDAERERDILRKHISIMDISHKTANDEYFKLAVENENLERERDLWKAEAEQRQQI